LTTRVWPILLLAAACGRDPDPVPESLDELRARLNDHSPDTRCAAAVKLWNATREFEPALRLLLEHAVAPETYRVAARHLPEASGIPPTRISEVAALAPWPSLAGLGAIGPQAKAHVGQVRSRLRSDDRPIAMTAAWALFKVTGAAAAPIRRLLELITAPGAPAPLRLTMANTILDIAKLNPQPLIDALQEKPYAAIARKLLALIRKDDPGYAAAQAALAH